MIEIIPNWHPLLVHFPLALISLSAFFHLAAMLLRTQPRYASPCAVLAHATLWLAALAVFPTVLLGWLASNAVNHDEAGHAAMLLHRSWAWVSVTVLIPLAGIDIWRHKVDSLPKWTFASVVMLVWLLLASTAWHGAELVYRHGLGVMAMPKSAESGHLHTPTAAPNHAEIPAQSAVVPHEAGGHQHHHAH